MKMSPEQIQQVVTDLHKKVMDEWELQQVAGGWGAVNPDAPA